jgi:hypothetical protein
MIVVTMHARLGYGRLAMLEAAQPPASGKTHREGEAGLRLIHYSRTRRGKDDPLPLLLSGSDCSDWRFAALQRLRHRTAVLGSLHYLPPPLTHSLTHSLTLTHSPPLIYSSY